MKKTSKINTTPATIHIPKDLKLDAQLLALRQGVTFSDLITQLLEAHVAASRLG